jgi:hypothetical protein
LIIQFRTWPIAKTIKGNQNHGGAVIPHWCWLQFKHSPLEKQLDPNSLELWKSLPQPPKIANYYRKLLTKVGYLRQITCLLELVVEVFQILAQ